MLYLGVWTAYPIFLDSEELLDSFTKTSHRAWHFLKVMAVSNIMHRKRTERLYNCIHLFSEMHIRVTGGLTRTKNIYTQIYSTSLNENTLLKIS